MSQPAKSRKITLVHCGEKGGYVHIPLSILTLAESLMKNGYEARLVDLRIQDLTMSDLEDSLYLGVSLMTGSMQIPPALACAQIAKSMSIPVVFGGAHPSILLEQTAVHPLVDIAVKGEGEEVAVELAEYFMGNIEVNSIRGIAYKCRSGSVVFTGDRKPPPFDRITHLPYDLLPMDKYLASNNDFTYQSSRGCPHRCAFCAEVALYPKTWRAKPAHVIIEEYVIPGDKGAELRGQEIRLNKPHIFVLSAKNEKRLKIYAGKMADFLEKAGSPEPIISTDQESLSENLRKDFSRSTLNLAEVAYTSQVGREAMDERLAVIVGSVRELEEKLE